MDALAARVNLWLLFRMRLCGGAALAALTRVGGAAPEAMPEALWPAAGWLAATAWTFVRLRGARPVSDREFFAHLLPDFAVLTCFFFLCGGAGNPFTSLLIAPVCVAAATLSAVYSRACALTAALCYTALMLAAPVTGHEAHANGGRFGLHVTGMWLSFLLLCWLLALFGERMRAVLNDQSERMAMAEQTAALGAFAAAAAHELATPLAAAAALADGCPPEHAEPLKEQIRRCRTILSRVAAAGGAPRAEGGERARVDGWLLDLAEEWRRLRPGTALRLEVGGVTRPDGTAPELIGEYALRQAVMNLLHNAADVSPEQAEVVLTAYERREAGMIDIIVRDHGPGPGPEAMASLARAGVTGKPEGLGMGLYLAGAVIRRIGGTLSLTSAPGGGTCAAVRLPAV